MSQDNHNSVREDLTNKIDPSGLGGQIYEIAHGLGGPASVIQGTIAGLRKAEAAGDFTISHTMGRLIELLEGQVARLEETSVDLRSISERLTSVDDPTVVNDKL